MVTELHGSADLQPEGKACTLSNTVNFSLPGAVLDNHWPNQWYGIQSESTEISFSEHGQLVITRDAKHASHALLNARLSDIKTPQAESGVRVRKNRKFTVQLDGVQYGQTQAQIVIHEYDADQQRLGRWLVELGSHAIFEANPATVQLVVSLRTVGIGRFELRRIEITPAPNHVSPGPGLHLRGDSVRVAPLTKDGEVGLQKSLAVLVSIRTAFYHGTPLSALLSRSEARLVVGQLIEAGQMMDAMVVVREVGLYSELTNRELRALFAHGRKSGYLAHALTALDEVILRRGQEKDKTVANRVRGELEFHRDPWSLLQDFDPVDSRDTRGPILHMVGKALPEKQTGFTVRTKYTVDALRRAGIESVIAVQSAGNYIDGLPEAVEQVVDGTHVVLFGGEPARTAGRVNWFQRNAQELYELVRRVRPSVIHAHSDFTNGVLATHVGEATGVPVVYESRGFWEETWMSRVSTALHWENVDHIMRMYGIPDLYLHRKNAERSVRERADRIVTLAQTMKDYILEESAEGQIQSEHIYLARNAVNAEEFPVGIPQPELRESLSIDEDATVLGYISSIVEYEGIETLIDAYANVKKTHASTRLVIVGDGMHLNRLKRHAERQGLTDILFTGRVAHEEVLAYYSMIDVFVVPRRKTKVTDLVTPLKPFEAFSTGRAVVMSDVGALSEIASDSEGGAQTFIADDVDDLSRILIDLVDDPEKRASMGAKAASWVRSHRSWDSNVPAYRELYQSLNCEL